MSDRPGPRFDREERRKLPSLPFGPGREAYPKRARALLAAVLALALLGAAVIGALLVHSRAAPLRVVTIPLADRGASPALLRSAEDVGFEPVSERGAGTVEGDPVVPLHPPSAPGLLPAGAPAPTFTLRTPTGEAVSLAAQRGRAVLVEFFATWCGHCDAEAPHLVRIARSLPRSRYALLAIDGDSETAPSVLAYHIYYGFPYPALLDPGGRPGSFHAPGGAGPVSRSYRVSTFPTFYVLDPAGRVVWAANGEQPDLLLVEELHDAAGRGGAKGAPRRR